MLTIVTQITATTLIAARIYSASQPFRISGEVEDGCSIEAGQRGFGKGVMKYEPTQREKYLSVVWIVVESGAIYSSAAIVQLVTYLLHMNAGVNRDYGVYVEPTKRECFFSPSYVFFVFVLSCSPFFLR